MIKKFAYSLTVCLLGAILIFSNITYAEDINNQVKYDYRTTELSETSDYRAIQNAQSEINQVVQAMKGNDTPQISRKSATVSLENGVKVYSYSMENLLELLGNSKLSSDFLKNDRYGWIFPLSKNTNGYEVVIASHTSSGYSYEGNVCEDNRDETLDYIFTPELVEQTLQKNDISDPDIVVPLNILRYRTHIIFVESGDNSYVIPFASNPEYLGLENNTLYTVDQFCTQVESHKTSSDVANTPVQVGGMGSITPISQNTITIPGILVIVGLTVSILAAVIIFSIVIQRKRRQIK